MDDLPTPSGLAVIPNRSSESPRPVLDPLETTSADQQSPADDEAPFINADAVPFEHRGWMPMRKRVFASMCRTEASEQRKHDFWNCGSRVHVLQEASSKELDVIAETCHDRFCMPCGQRRSLRIRKSIGELMKERPDKLMFITLTIRGTPSDSLQSMLDRLKDGWNALRKLDGWKNTIRGGVVMTEVKWSSTSGGHWHPHYHLIAEGCWLEEDWLKRAWEVLTRGSDQVKVIRITEIGKALSYVAKYASKPMDASFIMKCGLLDEAMTVLKGVRLTACFGSWYGTPLMSPQELKDETDCLTNWLPLGTTDDLFTRARQGDRDASIVLQAVERILRLRHAFSLRRPSARANDPTAPPFDLALTT